LNEWQILKNLYGQHLPKTVQLVELGPGRATLMNDLLNVTASQLKKVECAVSVAFKSLTKQILGVEEE
jgi:SAM-dependent MidA family methyltransferase